MDLSLFGLPDQVAIVTGSSRGIGQSLAQGLAWAGAHVVITSRHPEQLEETAELVRAEGRRVLSIGGDVRDPAAIQAIVDQTMAEFGRIDILVNNAGASFVAQPQDISERGWDAVININLKGPFLFSKAVFPIMRDQGGGVIVNIGSRAGLNGTAEMSHYGAAKAALENLTNSLASAWAPYNIRVNCVAPGATKTKEAIDRLWETPQREAETLARITLGRMAETEEMIGPVIFFASKASSYITGSTLYVDGGIKVR